MFHACVTKFNLRLLKNMYLYVGGTHRSQKKKLNPSELEL